MRGFFAGTAAIPGAVMAGLVPAIHVLGVKD
jgi:hypothetical protein